MCLFLRHVLKNTTTQIHLCSEDAVEHGQQGLLTANDSEALARAIEQTLDNPTMLNRFSKAARKRAAEFSMQQQAKKMTAVYEQAIEAKRAVQTVPTLNPKRSVKALLGSEMRGQFSSATRLAGRRW